MTAQNGSPHRTRTRDQPEEAERVLAERVREALWQAQVQHMHAREWFNFASDGYMLTDRDGVIHEANFAAVALLDVRKEFLLGKPLGLFVTAEHRRRFYEHLARFSERDSVERWETQVCRVGGQPRDVALMAAALPGERGGLKLRWMLHDLTELREARQRALQAERLAAIGQMVAGLAHESRNALQRSQACLALLALRLQDRPECLELLGRIEKAQDDLQHLFNDVRTSATAPRLQRRWHDLRSCWREAWGDLAPLPEWATAVLEEKRDTADLLCQVDPFYLKQVFRNLLENALASGANPVRVIVRCEPAYLNAEEALCIRLRDNGIGIPADARARLFEPFFTTKVRGTGLGLAICRRIVEAHGGRIHVGDTSGSGAEIILTLPRRET